MNHQICVIGAGRWGKNHINTLHQLGYLGAIVESNRDVLDQFKAKYPSVETYINVDDALGKYTGYTIATPAETHFEIGKKVINAGHHLLIEKPITLTSEDAAVLHELASEAGINLMVGHVLLFHPAFIKIKEMLAAGDLGDLQYAYSNRLNLGTIRTEENVFWSFAPHDIALFQYLIGSFPTEITSSGADILQKGIHDTTITTLKYGTEVMGHIFVSWLHPFKEHRFVVVGSKGMIRFEDSVEGKPLVLYDKGVDWKAGVPTPRSGETEQIVYGSTMALTAELQYFYDHLDGTRIDTCDSGSAIEVMKILEIATRKLEERNDV